VGHDRLDSIITLQICEVQYKMQMQAPAIAKGMLFKNEASITATIPMIKPLAF
jgi:hypothetical protein